MKWTQEQQQVISSRNREVLVSAAAGSGKTAVLAQRVADMVLHDHLVMEELLVLTFTRASAADMRRKIEQQLTALAADDSISEEDRIRCTDEAHHLPLAQISTIDSYCNRVVREFFAQVPIDPGFAVCDEGDEDAKRLFDLAVQDALNSFYEHAGEKETHQSFITTYPTTQVEEMLRTLYAFLMARPNPEAWLNTHCSADFVHSASDPDGPLSRYCQKRFEQALQSAEENLSAMAAMLNDPLCPPKYQEMLPADDEVLDAFRACVGQPPEAWAVVAKNVKWKRMVTVPAKTMPEGFEGFKAQFMDVRNAMKELSSTIAKEALTPEAISDVKATAPYLSALSDLCRLLIDANRQIKRRYNRLTFSDVAQAAYTLMQDEAVAERLRRSAKAIFVDEYQDVSPLQEAMLQRLLHEDCTLFYVGDVKQSIYRFRNAKPSNFIQKMQAFRPEEEALQRTITLNKNFRSAPAVLDTANRVMSELMRADANELDYDEAARLYQGADLPDTARTELHLVLAPQTEQPKRDALYAQLYSAVQTIRHLHDTAMVTADGKQRKARYDDFAILIPRNSMGAAAQSMLECFRIQSENEQAESFYETPEVRDLIEFLNLLDSPQDDDALLCVMKSWLFAFTSEELAQIRIAHPEGTLHEAVAAAGEGTCGEGLQGRIAEMLAFIDAERFRIHNSNLFLYLWDFVRRTGLYDSIQNLPGGFTARTALDTIVFEAIEFEETHFQGIYAFTERLRRRAESKHKTPVPSSPDTPDCVHIMTIHKSKGLQFPFVLLIGLEHSLRGMINTTPIRLHDDFGTAIPYINPDLHVRRDTMLWNTINKKTDEENRAEYVRLLYVALTRASQQTLLFGSVSDLPAMDELLGGANKDGTSFRRSTKDLLYWLLHCVRPYDIVMEQTREDAFLPERLGEPVNNDRPWNIILHPNPVVLNPFEAAPEPTKAEESKAGQDAVLRAGPNPLRLQPFEYEQRLSESLQPLIFPQLPKSVSPSQVNRAMQSGMVLPTADADILDLKRIPAFEPKQAQDLPLPELREPNFDAPNTEEHTARARGTATHILLQLCDYKVLRQTLPTLPALTAALQRDLGTLHLDGRISDTDYELADPRMAARFFLHPLGQAALRSSECYREKQFFCYYLPPLESILLRGAIDLCYYDEGESESESGWVLLDYKTDFFTEPGELLAKYRPQLDCYRRALTMATGRRVKLCGLFSLRTGKAITVENEG